MQNLALVQYIVDCVPAYPTNWHQISVAMLAMLPQLAPTTPACNYQGHVQAATTLQANMQAHLQSVEYPNGQHTWK